MTELVRGEASESDDEMKCDTTTNSVFASEINGEASESDSDNEASGMVATTPNRNILQQLLIKNNTSAWTNLNAYVNKIITEPTKPLLSMEHLLIKTQVTFSSMLSSLKIAQNNVKQMHERASDVFTANYIPDIKM